MTVTMKRILDHWGFHEEWRHGFPQSLYDNPTPLNLKVNSRQNTKAQLREESGSYATESSYQFKYLDRGMFGP